MCYLIVVKPKRNSLRYGLRPHMGGLPGSLNTIPLAGGRGRNWKGPKSRVDAGTFERNSFSPPNTTFDIKWHTKTFLTDKNFVKVDENWKKCCENSCIDESFLTKLVANENPKYYSRYSLKKHKTIVNEAIAYTLWAPGGSHTGGSREQHTLCGLLCSKWYRWWNRCYGNSHSLQSIIHIF